MTQILSVRLACSFTVLVTLLCAGPANAVPSEGGESVEQAMCRLIEGSARTYALPVPYLTRLIFRESAFKVGVVSPAGAQGVAQFMPGTAKERGLLDPFDPEQAVPHAAHLLSDLRQQFGNLGLAAAAYNAGPGRVSGWLSGERGLPAETRAYVLAITGRPAEDWRPGADGRGGSTIEMAPDDGASDDKKPETKETVGKSETTRSEIRVAEKPAHKGNEQAEPQQSCLTVTAALRIPSRGDRFALPVEGGPAAPWGIQLAGNFSKQLALVSFSRARDLYAGVIGTARPMIIGTRLRYRGTRAFYRVRIPAETRAGADALCARIRQAGGACVVLRT